MDQIKREIIIMKDMRERQAIFPEAQLHGLLQRKAARQLPVTCFTSASGACIILHSPLICLCCTIETHVSCADHPHVVDLKEVMASKDKIYMVMEFMPGGELFDKIVADGPLEVSFIQAIHLACTGQGRQGPGPVE